METPVLPQHPVIYPAIRRYRETFHQCHFLHIPTIVHGLYTPRLFITIYGLADQGYPPIMGQYAICPQTFCVHVAFLEVVWFPGLGFVERLMPPQSGTIVLQA